MTRNASKLLVLFLSITLVASSCGGKSKRPVDEVKKLREADASDVRPPPRVDPKYLAQPGLTLATNSPTWQKLVDSPEGRGAVVLFVQPNGPTDRKNVARGDMIVEIDGKRVTNFEYALTLLRSAKGDRRKLKVMGRNGKTRDVTVKNDIPRDRPRRALDLMIRGNPSDPVLHYLRSVSVGGTFADALADLKAALDIEPAFVEALSVRGNYLFSQRRFAKDKKQSDALTAEALANWTNALDIDPHSADTLVYKANAETAIGKPAQAKADAVKALRIDGTNPAANNALARSNLALKKPQDAAGPAAAALQLNPYNNLTYYRTLAQAFRDLKRKTDCQETLNAVVPYLEGTRTKALKTEAEELQREAKRNCG